MIRIALNADRIQRLMDLGRGDLVRRYSKALTPLDAFTPRPDLPEEFDEQTAFFQSKAKFAICLGGNRSGKTIAAAAKCARYLRDTKPYRELCPFWILGETFEQTCAVCWDEKLRHFIDPKSILTIDYYNIKRNWPRAVILHDPEHYGRAGWIIEFKSYDQGVALMQGRSIGGFWFNEECPLSLVHEVRVRCADYDACGWADFTPVHIRDPQWSDLHDEPPPGWEFFHLNVYKNKTRKIQDWAKQYFAAIPEEERATRETGVFANFHGMVFKEFAKRLHVIDQLPTPDAKPGKHWRRFRGIDFGFSNPTACLWITQDRDGRFYIYDEHYESQELIEYHAARINEREWNYNSNVYGTTYCDSENPTDILRLQTLTGSKSFVAISKKKDDIGRHISLIRTLMMPAGDGKPRLYILSKCVNLIREIRGYRWSEPTGMNLKTRQVGPRTKNPIDIPIQWNDHAIDAMRYAIYNFAKGPAKAPHAVRRPWQSRESLQANIGRR